MKKLLSLVLSLALALALGIGIAPPASAAGDMAFSFVLSASATSVKVGDSVTVGFALNRTDASADYKLYSMQNEICYDSRYFELVGNVSLTDPAFDAATRAMSDGIHKKIIISFVDFSGSGAATKSALSVCTFVLKALQAGSSVIENTDYKVNLPSGRDVYASTANTVSMTVSGGTSNPGGNTGDNTGGNTGNTGGTGTNTGSNTGTSSGDSDDDNGATASGTEDTVFTDVAAGDWYYEAVQFVVSRGLFEGTGSGLFSPDASMTRAMLVTVLYRLAGSPSVTGSNDFPDVQSGQWYTKAVLWADQNGIVTGYDDGRFGTSDNITREQIAAILYRYARYMSYDTGATTDFAGYTDAGSVSDWAGAAMRWANAEGFITGRTSTTLVPGGFASRAEVAAILMRFAERYAA